MTLGSDLWVGFGNGIGMIGIELTSQIRHQDWTNRPNLVLGLDQRAGFSIRIGLMGSVPNIKLTLGKKNEMIDKPNEI